MSFLLAWRRRLEASRQERRMARINANAGSLADHVGSSWRLIKNLDLSEAEAIVDRGLRAYPGAVGLLTQKARIATRRGHHVEAKALWTMVKTQRVNFVEAWVAVAIHERVLSQIDDAAITISEALRRVPRNPMVVCEAARVWDRCGYYDKALPLWERLRAGFPDSADYLQGCAYDLIQLHRFDEAGALLRDGTACFPDSRELAATAGVLAMALEDWDEAIAIWKRFRVKWPDDQTGWDNLGRTLTSKHLADIETGTIVGADRPIEVPRVEDEAKRRLMLNFESLGSDCEFGMVQRRYGAEPLGLLRWNYVALESLIAALSAGLADMGDPEFTEFWPGKAAELYLQDKRWGLAMHTFLSSTQTDKALLFPRMCKRIAYLRDKLIEDLRAAEKIFVFKAKSIALQDLLTLHAILRTFGPSRLIGVVVADPTLATGPFAGKPGEVRQIKDGLFVGFLGRLGGDQGFWDIAFDDWIAICGFFDNVPTALAHAGDGVA